jgi:hypothetical protein
MTMKIAARSILRLALSSAMGLIGVGLSTGTVLAQGTTGTIAGTVTDPDGALVQAAAISVYSASGSAKKLVSDAAGAFVVVRLVPGRYELKVSAKGFSAATLSDVMVTGGKTTSTAVKLGISVSTDLEVSADAIRSDLQKRQYRS